MEGQKSPNLAETMDADNKIFVETGSVNQIRNDNVINNIILTHKDVLSPYNINFHAMIILQIFKHLDWKSLKVCSQVCHSWCQITLEPCLYQNLSLKKCDYETQIAFFKFLENRCSMVKKFEYFFYNHKPLSSFTYDNVNCLLSSEQYRTAAALKFVLAKMLQHFLQQCSNQLTILNICYFVNNAVLAQIGECKNLTKLYLTDLFDCSLIDFSHLLQLRKLVSVNFSNTGIDNT